MADAPSLPPQDLAAERSVLGACLLDQTALVVAGEWLRAEDFYRSVHQQIFRAMQAVSARGEALDHLTVADELGRRGDLEQIGGVSAVAELLLEVATAVNIRSHAKVVADKSLLRQIRQIAVEVEAEAMSGALTGEEVLHAAEQRLYRLAQGTSPGALRALSSVVDESIEHLERLQAAGSRTAITGVPSGISALDRLTAGWQPTDMVVIAARPSMGKTSLALGMARHAALHAGVSVAMFSLEMSARQLGNRLIAMQARLDGHASRTGSLGIEEWRQVLAAGERLREAPLWIDDSGTLTLAQLRSRARRLKSERSLDLLIVDYIQLLTGRPSAESRQQEMAELSRGLKQLAKELEVPVLVLSQLNRACESRADKRPLLADLRESGAIEQDADVVLFLYRDEVYDRESPDRGFAELLVRKHRNGPIGDVRLIFHEAQAQFVDLNDAR